MKTPARRSYSIGSVQRCLHLLRLFAQAPGGLTPAEVGKLSGLPTSTVYRFLFSLETAGFLSCGERGKIPHRSHLLSERAVRALPSRDPATELALLESTERTHARNGAPSGKTRPARDLCGKTRITAASHHHFANRRLRAPVLYGGWENPAGVPSRGRASASAAPDRAEISYRAYDSQYRGASETGGSRPPLRLLLRPGGTLLLGFRPTPPERQGTGRRRFRRRFVPGDR